MERYSSSTYSYSYVKITVYPKSSNEILRMVVIRCYPGNNRYRGTRLTSNNKISK